ncbi:MAG: TetR/AcrR family transcriptional regulator, partial [Actinomycetes bacterium]
MGVGAGAVPGPVAVFQDADAVVFEDQPVVLRIYGNGIGHGNFPKSAFWDVSTMTVRRYRKSGAATSQREMSGDGADPAEVTHPRRIGLCPAGSTQGRTGSSVADVAAIAGISRTTAYRYFPDKEALLHAALPETGLASLLGDRPPSDVPSRLARTLDAHFGFIRTWDPQLRAALRLSLTPGAA